jgi:hypothetical protein
MIIPVDGVGKTTGCRPPVALAITSWTRILTFWRVVSSSVNSRLDNVVQTGTLMAAIKGALTRSEPSFENYSFEDS